MSEPVLPTPEVSEPTRACGMIGPGDPARLRAMGELLGLGREHVIADEHSAAADLTSGNPLSLLGAGVVARPATQGRAWMFSTATPRPARIGPAPLSWEQAARDADVAGLTQHPDGTVTLHTGISGVQPVYVQDDGEVLWFATRLEALVRTAAEPLRPDWSAWAAVLGAGAPMAGRTTVESIRRLAPMESVTCGPDGRCRRASASWPWEQITPEPGLRLEEVRRRGLAAQTIDALRAEVATVEDSPRQPMLSGGRDSRMLTGLAAELTQAAGPDDAAGALTAWSTNSDIGHTLEELTGARIARLLGIEQRIVTGAQADFATDFLDYARATGFQASFHVWLMPVARELAQQPGTILDGLGGGVFLGGGFPDSSELLAVGPTPEALVENRFARACKYLAAVRELLAPSIAEGIEARTWDDFRLTGEQYAAHPNGATLTAYLTRTLPGISMAPAAVLGSARPTAVPIMAHQVVSRALAVPHAAKRDGAWYPDLMAEVRPEFRDVPTAAELTTVRQHIRRGATREAAAWYRSLVLSSPAAALLGPRLAEGGPEVWQAQLQVTGGQHVIRGLALLALWCAEHEGRLSGLDVAELGRR